MQLQRQTENSPPGNRPAPRNMMTLTLLMATGLFIMLWGLARGLQMLP